MFVEVLSMKCYFIASLSKKEKFMSGAAVLALIQALLPLIGQLEPEVLALIEALVGKEPAPLSAPVASAIAAQLNAHAQSVK